jgi:pyruvate dehydrogenase E2 component (dihydrolipoamide acetyltransferase)
MAIVSLRIPQIGEGLQEARVVALLKQPGDLVRRDEPIYQMETDKAVMDVESPYEGRLVAWLAAADDVLAINAEVVTLETSDAVAESEAAPAPVVEVVADETPSATSRLTGIPPRTRAYAKEKGVSDEILATLVAAGSKLMSEDVDAFLAGGAQVSEALFQDAPLSSRQRIIASRLMRGSSLVVPGTMSVVVSWEAIEEVRARFKAARDEFQPSTFTIFSYAVTKAMEAFPAFRSTLLPDLTLRTFNHVNLGIAVALPGDGLVMAVVEKADTYDFPEFAAAMRERIQAARNAVDQVNEKTTFSLTNMSSYRLRDAVPVVVPPMVGTLFVGEVYNGLAQGTKELKLQRCCNLGLTFDHRAINGVGAAEFINAIRENAENIQNLIA